MGASRGPWLVLVLGMPLAVLGVSNGCGSSDSKSPSSGGAGGTRTSGPDPGDGGDAGTNSGGVAVPCASDKRCTSANQLCDPNRNVCVGCLTSSDCAANQLCDAGSCVAIRPCMNSLDCAADQVCASGDGRCVECVDNADCADTSVCVLDSCHRTCASDKDCTGQNQLCDKAGGYCVDCLGDADCRDVAHCEASRCVPNACEPTSTLCLGSDLFTCNAHGTGYARLTCSTGCDESGGAHCAVEGSGGTSGAGAAGAPGAGGRGGAGSGGACVPETITVSNCGMTGARTTNSYSGVITLTVSGLLSGSSGSFTDAFYNETPTASQCRNCLVYNHASEGACLCSSECPSTSHPVADILLGGYPGHDAGHVYTVQVNLGDGAPEPLDFSYGDCGCFDNSGNWSLSIGCP